VPGPGAYNFSTFNLKNVYAKIGTGSRYKNDKSETPGPGAYEFYKDSKKGVTISGIKNKKNIEITPGPGTYEADGDCLGKRPCSASIGTGLRSKAESLNTPGPGSYNLEMH